MPMYNLLEYSKNYRKTSISLFNYYEDEPNDSTQGAGNAAIHISIDNSKSFDYKKNGIDRPASRNRLEIDAEIAISLKHLGNFWRNLEMPLINCEITLTLSWYKKCVLVSRAFREAPSPQSNPPTPAINSPTSAQFGITDCRLYVPVATLSAKDHNKLLGQLKSGFKRAIKWNKYTSQMSNQGKNHNLNYLIDPAFGNVNRLFVLSFENEDDRTSYYKYCVPNVEIKDYNVLIDGKAFYELPVRSLGEAYEKITQIASYGGYYTKGNLLSYNYFKRHYKLIAIDLSKQIELENKDIKQQINFIGRLERKEGVTMFFIIKKSEEAIAEFSQNYASIIQKMESQKIFNLLNGNDSESQKFATKIWYIINDQYGANKYGNGADGTTIKFETKVIKPILCDYSDAYILVTGNILNKPAGDNIVGFKNCALFRTCDVVINDDLDVVMPMYNLLEYSDNYS